MDSENTPQKSYKLPAALLIGVVLGALVSWAVLGSIYKKKIIAVDAGIRQEIRGILKEKGFVPPVAENITIDVDTPLVIDELQGIIIEIGDSSITIESLIQDDDILLEDTTKRIIVNFSSDTSFFFREEKDFEIFDAEQLAWNKLSSNTDPENFDTLPLPPLPFTLEEVASESFEIGSLVSISMETPYDGGSDVVATIVTGVKELQNLFQALEDVPEDIDL